jgi:hypothetical protein
MGGVGHLPHISPPPHQCKPYRPKVKLFQAGKHIIALFVRWKKHVHMQIFYPHSSTSKQNEKMFTMFNL